MTIIAYLRETSCLTDPLVMAYVAAQQIQIDRDFRPLWPGDQVECLFVPPGGNIPDGAWQVLLLDNSDMAEALGYHDATGPGGAPRSKVFVADDLRNGVNWTVTASHETLEMLADPQIDQTTQATIDGVTYEYPMEVCDCCEDDQFAYPINGVHLTDFALRSWFNPNDAGPYTFRGTVNAPLTLADGGYTGRREVAPMAGLWSQVFAQGVRGARTVKGPASRTMRRFGG